MHAANCGNPGDRLTMDGEWRSELPDGREVVVQRKGEQWIVRCASAHALATNPDVALAQVIHAATDAGHAHEIHYPTWIRDVADKLALDE
jgi:hypothetical protein